MPARQSQEFARQLAQWVWQTGGIPGREEIGQVNRQVYELANRLDELGSGLAPGEFVMPGSFCSPTDIEPGDEIVAEFGICGRVSVRVA